MSVPIARAWVEQLEKTNERRENIEKLCCREGYIYTVSKTISAIQIDCQVKQFLAEISQFTAISAVTEAIAGLQLKAWLKTYPGFVAFVVSYE